jgi:hypothetical protein
MTPYTSTERCERITATPLSGRGEACIEGHVLGSEVQIAVRLIPAFDRNILQVLDLPLRIATLTEPV